MLEVGSKREDHEGQGAVVVLVLVLHVPRPEVMALAIKAGLVSLNPPLPLHVRSEGQEEKLPLAPLSTTTSLRAIIAMPRDISDHNAPNQ